MAISRVPFFLALFLLASVASISASDDSDSKEFVLTLDHSNFSETIAKHDFVVVEFYAPWYADLPPIHAVRFVFGQCWLC